MSKTTGSCRVSWLPDTPSPLRTLTTSDTDELVMTDECTGIAAEKSLRNNVLIAALVSLLVSYLVARFCLLRPDGHISLGYLTQVAERNGDPVKVLIPIYMEKEEYRRHYQEKP